MAFRFGESFVAFSWSFTGSFLVTSVWDILLGYFWTIFGTHFGILSWRSFLETIFFGAGARRHIFRQSPYCELD